MNLSEHNQNGFLFDSPMRDTHFDEDRNRYMEGYKACRRDRDRDDNPYTEERAHTQWNRGWCSAEYDTVNCLGDFIS